MKKEDCYFLGKINRRHGLQGNVLLKLDTDQPELYSKLDAIFVEINGLLTPFFIQKCSWSKIDVLNILIKNATDTMVDQMIGRNVFLPLATLPPLSGNQFYYHEVIGFEIVNTENQSCGVIEEINDQTAQPYFILKLNQRDVVIPIIKDWIVEVNRENKRIEMQLPDGLLDVFLSDQKKDE